MMAGLPIDHAFRNLARRPLRTALTALASALVAALLVGTSAFVRGLERGFVDASGNDTAIVMSAASERDVVRSSISVQVPDLLAAGVSGIRRVDGVAVIPADALGDESATRQGARVQTKLLPGVPSRDFAEGVPRPRRGDADRRSCSSHGRSRRRTPRPRTLRGLGRSPRRRFVRALRRAVFEVVEVFAAPGTTLESEIWTPANELRGLHATR
jgi:hypothetical protein